MFIPLIFIHHAPLPLLPNTHKQHTHTLSYDAEPEDEAGLAELKAQFGDHLTLTDLEHLIEELERERFCSSRDKVGAWWWCCCCCCCSAGMEWMECWRVGEGRKGRGAQADDRSNKSFHTHTHTHT